jgi:hypothetical protein
MKKQYERAIPLKKYETRKGKNEVKDNERKKKDKRIQGNYNR